MVGHQIEFKTGSFFIPPKLVAGRPSSNARGACSNEQSIRSRIRAAFWFANANVEFAVMATLTFDKPSAARMGNSNGSTAKRPLKALLEWLRRRGILSAWIMEFTRAGSVHFHLFLPMIEGIEWKVVMRRGKETKVCKDSGFARDFAEVWIRVAEQSVESFHRGGILELLREPSAAARYVAKEASKRIQKVAPETFSNPGRWWGIPREWKPVELVRREIEITPRYKYSFDKHNIVEKEVSPPLVITKANSPS